MIQLGMLTRAVWLKALSLNNQPNNQRPRVVLTLVMIKARLSVESHHRPSGPGLHLHCVSFPSVRTVRPCLVGTGILEVAPVPSTWPNHNHSRYSIKNTDKTKTNVCVLGENGLCVFVTVLGKRDTHKNYT